MPRNPYSRRGPQTTNRWPRRDGREGDLQGQESIVRLSERGEFLVREGRTAEAASLYRRMLRSPAANTMGPWLESALAALGAPAGDAPGRPDSVMDS